MTNKTKVLVVDDSALVRQTLKDILNSDPDIEVLGTAENPYSAVNLMKAEKPDVITLDVEMPRMDGITFLEKIMSQHPIPVVICSSLTKKGSQTTLQALDNGAVEVIQKPKIGSRQFFEESRIRICETIKSAAKANLKRLRPVQKPLQPSPKLTADAVIPQGPKPRNLQTTDKVIAIGASTGGTQALTYILTQLPGHVPGIVIVQHMPEFFTANFASRLDSMCAVTVSEAKSDDSVLRGHVLLAPGNRHMLLKRSGARYLVDVRDGPLVCRHRPSVDVLFRSTARYAGQNAIGILLTGMGDDGAQGLLEMREADALTVAQNEESCVVFGMPREAIKRDAACKVMDLDQIIQFISNIK